MRRGEALGLDWNAHVDLDSEISGVPHPHVTIARTLAVSDNHAAGGPGYAFGEPKTPRGYRRVSLDPETVAMLRVHRARQAAEKLAIGGGYCDLGLVFCEPDGTPLHPGTVSEGFRRLTRQLGLPLSLHGLRHTWATLALKAGIHPKVVQERLGHSKIAVTLDLYSQVSLGMDAEAATRVAKLLEEPMAESGPGSAPSVSGGTQR